jgi:hypothetical protein
VSGFALDELPGEGAPQALRRHQNRQQVKITVSVFALW